MNWLHSVVDPIALRLLKWLNGMVGVIMAGIVAFSAMRPNFPTEMQTALHLTPVQGMVVGILWCSLIAYIVKRAGKNV